MPPSSRAQARFMRAVASGDAKAPGLSPQQAQEYVSGHPTKNLPERVGSKDGGRKRLKHLAPQILKHGVKRAEKKAG